MQQENIFSAIADVFRIAQGMTMTNFQPFRHIIALLCLFAPNLSHAEERYEVIDYCPSDWKLSAGTTIWGAGLNITKDAKKIVGTYVDTNGRQHGLIIQGKKCRTFDYPGVKDTQLGAANTRGELVGRTKYYSPSFGDFVNGAFLYRNGKFTTLPTYLNKTRPYINRDPSWEQQEFAYTEPMGITSSGLILAHHRFVPDEYGEFLFKKGKPTLLPLPGTASDEGLVYSFGINDKGVVVGFYRDYAPEPDNYGAFILKKGKLEVINYPGTDGSGTVFTGINNTNEIVGYNQTGQVGYSFIANGFLYRDGQFKTIMVPDSISTTPTAISDKGVVVGTFLTAEGAVKGFVYYPG